MAAFPPLIQPRWFVRANDSLRKSLDLPVFFTYSVNALSGFRWLFPANHRRPRSRRMSRVLFVDDHRDTANILCEIAEALGHHSSVTYCAATALQAVSLEHFDLVVLDITLPDGDGRDVCRKIRAEASTRPRIVALTGHSELANSDDMRDFDSCMVKPVDLDRLKQLLSE
jgi:two-component system OmpR family response regulator